jgi:hypothetical protein
MPRINHLFLNGAAGAKIAQGDFLTITDGVTPDAYEFRDDSPPTGGTAGRIWVYNGANAIASRTNLIKAVNGTVDAAVVNRTSATNHHSVTASMSTVGTYITIYETTAIGNGITQLTVVGTLQGTENLTEVTDIWDQLNFLQYGATADLKMAPYCIQLTDAMVAKGSLDFYTVFTPSHVFLINQMTRQDEEIILAGLYVTLTLAGGAPPNNIAFDVITALIFGA